MNCIPKVIDLVVQNDLCIGCGLCTYKCQSKAIVMQWNDNGFLIPVQIGTCYSDAVCVSVCPFNPFPSKEVQTENELSDIFLKETTAYHQSVGKYLAIYAGYAKEFRLTSSSGGIASFIFSELIERGLVNHILSVRESSKPGIHYEYAVSSIKQELLAASQTKYYPVTLSTVFAKIDELNDKVAIVGVACFIKAIRLAQNADPSLKEKIIFLVGIICGGVKSRFFTEYLSAKVGISKENCIKPEYRIKDLNSTAGDYSFGCLSNKDKRIRTIKIRSVCDMWGSGIFKSNACDFCDDVTTELADISLGDAWLSPFGEDGKGNNVVMTRTALAEQIVQNGLQTGKLYLEKLTLDRFNASQQGSYNHRQLGLPYRIKRAIKKKQLVPPKRFGKLDKSTFDFKIVQLFRMNIRKSSLKTWRNTENSNAFDNAMKTRMLLLKKVTQFYHYKQLVFTKKFIKEKIQRIFNKY